MIHRKTPLRRGTASLKRSPLRRVSKKRAAQLREYSERRARYLADHPVCEVWCRERGFHWQGPDRYAHSVPRPLETTGRALISRGAPAATEIHPTNKRRGEMLNDERHWLAVCRANHERIELNKAWARREGFLINF